MTAFAPAATAAPAATTVTATAQPGFDRIHIRFTGTAIPLDFTGNAEPPYGIGSGKERPIPGSVYYIHSHNGPPIRLNVNPSKSTPRGQRSVLASRLDAFTIRPG